MFRALEAQIRNKMPEPGMIESRSENYNICMYAMRQQIDAQMWLDLDKSTSS